MDNNYLNRISIEVRKDILRMLYNAGSGHLGGSLSCADILVALYFGIDSEGKNIMKYDPKNPFWEERDFFILSKGHAVPAYYVVLHKAGYDITEDELMSLRRPGTRLQGHPDKRALPYLETSTGSLGQGLSIAKGIALGLKMDGKSNRVYVLLGDGELQEGQCWEALRNSGQEGLDNLTIILDYNGWSIDNPTDCLIPLKDKIESFGIEVIGKDIHPNQREPGAYMDGNDPYMVVKYLEDAKNVSGKTQFIICNTLKGAGISIFENRPEYHGKSPNKEEFEIAMKELEEKERLLYKTSVFE